MGAKVGLDRELIGNRIAYDIVWPEAHTVIRCGGQVILEDNNGKAWLVRVEEADPIFNR